MVTDWRIAVNSLFYSQGDGMDFQRMCLSKSSGAGGEGGAGGVDVVD